MKDYSKMSCFEINKAVAEKRNMPFIHERGGAVCYQTQFGGSVMVKYCEDPSDAWPIIKRNHINIGWAGDEEWFARTVHTEKVFDVNPLRAAMIVYLMMKDEEQ